MVLTQVDATRFSDQFELRQGFFHLSRGEGTAPFLPASLDPAHFSGGHERVEYMPI
jgi:hypothetical protein